MAAPADVVPPASDIARQQNINIPRPHNVTSSPPPTMVGGAQGGPVDDQAAEAKFAQLQTDFKELNPQIQIYTQSAPKAPSLEEGGPFDTLTNEDECRVRHALDGGNSSDEVLLVHKASNIELKRVTLQCLKDKGLLNDEVIDLYLQLLKERELREPNKFLKCHFFNTFFYEKLNGKNGGYHYEAVRSWTKKKLGYNIIDCDKIFVPIHKKFIHKESHWCLAVINIRDKKFQYLDSLGFEDIKALEILARYLVDEIKDKNNKQIDVLSWEQEVVKERPSQDNNTDCGMFMLKYIDFYSRDMGLIFEQKHMPYFRRRTAKEILDLRAG
uniref:Uncharacterized protein n=1 Tax=Avena sativa TaxID=4498 RepID=A0ACD6AAN7_AVESA